MGRSRSSCRQLLAFTTIQLDRGEADRTTPPERGSFVQQQSHINPHAHASAVRPIWLGCLQGPLLFGVSCHNHHSERTTRQPFQSKESRYCQGLVTAMASHRVAPCTSSQVARQDTGQSNSVASGQQYRRYHQGYGTIDCGPHTRGTCYARETPRCHTHELVSHSRCTRLQ